MTHFDRQVFRAMVERARHMTDGELAALLADSEVSAVGRRVLEAESARRAGQQQTIAGA
jgi:hypothetical protein